MLFSRMIGRGCNVSKHVFGALRKPVLTTSIFHDIWRKTDYSSCAAGMKVTICGAAGCTGERVR